MNDRLYSVLRIRKTPVVTNQKASSPSRHNISFTSDRDDSPFVNKFESPLLRTLCPYGEIIRISLFSRLSGHPWISDCEKVTFGEVNSIICVSCGRMLVELFTLLQNIEFFMLI